METICHKVQFCVIGGGLAGMCAAIQAARHGVKTLIMQDRPVFGGNASSEIRMWICGSYHDLETGIIEEIRLENLHRNTYPNFSVWDSILYEKVHFQDNLTHLLNCSCLDAVTENNRIRSVTGWQMTTQTFHRVEAEYFADCSGDSILAPLTGAEFRIGRECKAEFNESLAQNQVDCKTMGLSCILQARETNSPKSFIPPSWANRYPDDQSFPVRSHDLSSRQNFWWLELGGDRNSIRDTEEIRDELLKTVFGIWDHIKNHGDHGAENWILDWVGFLPGKRESRRFIGDYILTQNDVLNGNSFDDIVAYGGWPVDDHHPAGFHHFGPPNINILPPRSYGIPLRCLYSKNIDNLMFAGRNISTSHVALSSTRVMSTCATLGQAVGTAVFHAIEHGRLSPRETCRKYIHEIQQSLMDDDCYLPGLIRNIGPLSANAKLVASGNDPEPLRNGQDRPSDKSDNAWHCTTGDWVEYDFEKAMKIQQIRIVFDSNLKRPHHNMVSCYPNEEIIYSPPSTLVKGFHLEADGREIFSMSDNYQRLVKIPGNVTAQKLRLCIDLLPAGCSSAQIFAFEVS